MEGLQHGTTSFAQLPLPARCALEYLGCQSQGQRSLTALDKYIDHYFRVSALECDEPTRASCHRIAIQRFGVNG